MTNWNQELFKKQMELIFYLLAKLEGIICDPILFVCLQDYSKTTSTTQIYRHAHNFRATATLVPQTARQIGQYEMNDNDSKSVVRTQRID